MTASEFPLQRQLGTTLDRTRRLEALTLLRRRLAPNAATTRSPEPGGDVNLHAHTFFSYNAYGYSPSKFAWLARKAGWRSPASSISTSSTASRSSSLRGD